MIEFKSTKSPKRTVNYDEPSMEIRGGEGICNFAAIIIIAVFLGMAICEIMHH